MLKYKVLDEMLCVRSMYLSFFTFLILQNNSVLPQKTPKSLKLIQNLETFVPYYMENDLKEYVESKMTKIDDLQRRNNGFENFVKYFYFF